MSSGEIIIGSAHALGVTEHAVGAFYKEHWARPIALSDTTFSSWQFKDAPYSNGHNECCVALIDDELVGIMGVTSWPFALNGSVHTGGVLTTWVVSPKARGRLIGNAILKWLQSKYDILLGTGITGDALPIYTKFDFHYLAAIPRYVKVIDWQNIRNYAEIEPLFYRILSKRDKEELPQSNSFEAQDSLNGFSRSPEYFNWRYTEHPYYRYEKLHIAEGETRADIYFRIHELADARIMHITDIISNNRNIGLPLQRIETLAQERGVLFIDYMQLLGEHQACLLERNWLSMVDEKYAQVMHLFSPPEMRKPPTTSLIVWAKTAELRRKLFNYHSLYLTKADLDLDRPTMNFIEQST